MSNTHSETYDPKEQDEIAAEFAALLRSATKDGAVKRAKGDKVSWKIDDTHAGHLYNHLRKWEAGDLVDKDSGAHPLVHLAWRALAIAWQDAHVSDEEDAAIQEQLKKVYY